MPRTPWPSPSVTFTPPAPPGVIRRRALEKTHSHPDLSCGAGRISGRGAEGGEEIKSFANSGDDAAAEFRSAEPGDTHHYLRSRVGGLHAAEHHHHGAVHRARKVSFAQSDEDAGRAGD